jgi:hypothetical protein
VRRQPGAAQRSRIPRPRSVISRSWGGGPLCALLGSELPQLRSAPQRQPPDHPGPSLGQRLRDSGPDSAPTPPSRPEPVIDSVRPERPRPAPTTPKPRHDGPKRRTPPRSLGGVVREPWGRPGALQPTGQERTWGRVTACSSEPQSHGRGVRTPGRFSGVMRTRPCQIFQYIARQRREGLLVRGGSGAGPSLVVGNRSSESNGRPAVAND